MTNAELARLARREQLLAAAARRHRLVRRDRRRRAIHPAPATARRPAR